MKLQTEAKKRERTLKSTGLKTKEVSNKLRGTKSASTKLKRKLKENNENVKKPRYSLVDTFSHQWQKWHKSQYGHVYGQNEIFAA